MGEGGSFEIWGRLGWVDLKLGRGGHGCGLWKSIRRGWEVFNKNVQYKVGVGDRVKFWKDRWCGDLPLKLAFPILYIFVVNREAFIESSLICQGVGDRRIWDVRFNHGPNDWEVDVVEEFLCLLPLGIQFTFRD